MARTFDIADKDCEELVKQVLKAYHPELDKLKIKLDLLFAFSDNVEVAPIMLHGHKCGAVIKIINLEDRIKGNGDAQIKIDKEYWDSLTERAKCALIDHELYHLVPDKDQLGHAKKDDAGRPKFKMRQHDVQIGWFTTIANRWGIDSGEQMQARDIWDEHGQAFFPFLTEGDQQEAFSGFDSTRKAA